MKTLPWSQVVDPQALCAEARPVIEEGGLVCLPCAGRYRILADFTNVDAVFRLMQSKGRVRQAPALVFIADETALPQVASEIDPIALRLAHELWPNPLTIRVKPNPELPNKILKQLGGSRSKIGVRVPGDTHAHALVRCLGRPLLVSSANREHKPGDSSPAQVRKTFGGRVDLFIDRGDLKPEGSSTVIDVKDGALVIERPGAYSLAELNALLGA